MKQSISYFQEFVNINRPKKENIMRTFMKSFSKLLIIVSLASVMFVGCSATSDFRPDKPYPDLALSELESCPEGVGEDAPRWVCNPEMIVSNRFPYAAIGTSHFPDATTAFRRDAAAAQGRQQIAASMSSSLAGSFTSKEHGESGQSKNVNKYMAMIKSVALTESRVIGHHAGTDGHTFALVVMDSRDVKQFKAEAKRKGFSEDSVFDEDKDFASLK